VPRLVNPLLAELNKKEPYSLTDRLDDADLIIINTCSVREKPYLNYSQRLVFLKNIRNHLQKLG